MKTTPPSNFLMAMSVVGVGFFTALFLYALSNLNFGTSALLVQTGTTDNNAPAAFTSTSILWLVVVVGGPVLLGLALAYAILKRRHLSLREKEAQREATARLYDK